MAQFSDAAEQAGSEAETAGPIWPGGPTAAPVCELACHAAARTAGIDWSVLHVPNRCEAAIARARQAAIYLAHVSGGVGLTQAANAMGRDRTTASHACQRIEDLRDDDRYDLALDYLDAILRRRSGDDVPLAIVDARPALPACR